MPRYKLTIAYDGTEFCGWQKQFPHADAVPPGVHAFKEGDPRGWEERTEAAATVSSSDTARSDDAGTRESRQNEGDGVDTGAPTGGSAATSPVGEVEETVVDTRPRRELRTVQAVVERAVRMVVRERIILSGASRTDAGVHARGQVASFKCSPETGAAAQAVEPVPEGVVVPRAARGGGWPIERGTVPLMRAINARLPDDVLVRSIEVVPDEFNPIANCTSKGYSYTLWCSDHRPLRERKTALHLWQRMDVGAMRAAAAEIVGEHDFAGFAAAGHGRLTTVRTVFGCEVVEEGTEGSRDRGWRRSRRGDGRGEWAGFVAAGVVWRGGWRGAEAGDPRVGQRVPVEHGADHRGDAGGGGQGEVRAGARARGAADGQPADGGLNAAGAWVVPGVDQVRAGGRTAGSG